MMDRRAFLKRMGLGLAVAPAVASLLLDRAPDWADTIDEGDILPLDVTKGYGAAMLNDGSYEACPANFAEFFTSTSLHSLNGSIAPTWGVALC